LYGSRGGGKRDDDGAAARAEAVLADVGADLPAARALRPVGGTDVEREISVEVAGTGTLDGGAPHELRYGEKLGEPQVRK
jgi:hypothetical protein